MSQSYQWQSLGHLLRGGLTLLRATKFFTLLFRGSTTHDWSYFQGVLSTKTPRQLDHDVTLADGDAPLSRSTCRSNNWGLSIRNWVKLLILLMSARVVIVCRLHVRFGPITIERFCDVIRFCAELLITCHEYVSGFCLQMKAVKNFWLYLGIICGFSLNICHRKLALLRSAIARIMGIWCCILCCNIL